MTLDTVLTQRLRVAPARRAGTIAALLAVTSAAGCSIVADDTRQVGQALSTGLVISQVYGGGGNSGATYTNDFVELFNLGTAPVSLNGLSIQYASATGIFNAADVLPLPNVTVPAGAYYLIQLAAGTTPAMALPTPDDVATVSINMSATAGKVALVQGTTAIACGSTGVPCVPATAGIVDMVGYGSTATAYEGTGPAPGPTGNTISVLRGGAGCTETDQNATDFVTNSFVATAGTRPRNLATAIHLCGTATDGGSATDAGTATDTGSVVDTGTGTDAGTPTDSGTATDTGTPTDAGTPVDGGSAIDSGVDTDAAIDAGGATDTGVVTDAGTMLDGSVADAGVADAAVDGAVTAEGGSDAAHDAATSDAAHDGGTDAGHDAGRDAGHDAGRTDSGVAADAGNDLGASGCNCSTVGAAKGGSPMGSGALATLVGVAAAITQKRRRRAR